MPQLDIYMYSTQVYIIVSFFIIFFLFFTKFWNKIIFQVEILFLMLTLFKKSEYIFLVQSFILQLIVKQPSSYLNLIIFSSFNY